MRTVFLDRVVDVPADASHRFGQVCAGGAEPTERLVRHLAELGHQRIALVAGRPGFSTTRERAAGYRDGLRAAGLPCDERLPAHGDSEPAGAERATAEHLLTLPAPPSALITADNATTIGALRALRTRGLSYPATSRCAASTTAPGPTCSRPGSPPSHNPAGSWARTPSGCSRNARPTRIRPPGPSG